MDYFTIVSILITIAFVVGNSYHFYKLGKKSQCNKQIKKFLEENHDVAMNLARQSMHNQHSIVIHMLEVLRTNGIINYEDESQFYYDNAGMLESVNISFSVYDKQDNKTTVEPADINGDS